jgi:hypothetical protein
MNKLENEFVNYAKSKGWKVTKQGWPDYLVMDLNDNPIGAIEVKGKQSHKDFIEDRPSLATTKRLKFQKRVRQFFMNKGIPCYVWVPGSEVEL